MSNAGRTPDTQITGTTARRTGRAALGLTTALACLAGLVVSAAIAPAYAATTTLSPGLPSSTTTKVGRTAPSTKTISAGRAARLGRPVGFGAATTGGAGGRVYTVTTPDDSLTSPVPGSLRWALAQPGPRWIVFASDMTIRFAGPMSIPSLTTVDGRGHAVLLTGHGVAGFQVYGATNVIISHVTMRDFGDTALTATNDPSDAIDIAASTNVWVDHTSLSHVGDKLIAVHDGARGVTLSWNHLYDQEQAVQVGTMASASADVDTSLTVDHNWFDHVGYRTPLVAYAKVHVLNNFMDSWTNSAVRSERLAQVYVEGNIMKVATSRKALTTTVAQICNDYGTICDYRGGYLTQAGTYAIGKATLVDTGASTVFSPRAAYPYTAEVADDALEARIVAGVGAPDASALIAALPDQAPAPVATTPAVPTKKKARATLAVANTRSGVDVLKVATDRGRTASGATVFVYRKVRSHWARVGTTRLGASGAVWVRVRDSNRHAWSYYRAQVGASTRTERAGATYTRALR